MRCTAEFLEFPSPALRIDCRAWAPTFHPELREGPLTSVDPWLEAVKACIPDLPPVLHGVFRELVAGRGPVAVHLTGLPVPSLLAPTPVDTLRPPPRGERNAEMWLALFGSCLGVLFAHREICAGQLFHSVSPEPGQEYQPTGVCSLGRLTMHNDGVTHPMPPDFVVLWCHRGQEDVRTAVASARRATEALAPDDRRLLYEPRFRHRLDYEFRASVGPGYTEPAPIFHEGPLGTTVAVDVDFMECPTGVESGIVKRLEDALESVAAQITLAPGEMLIMDNHRSAHARDGFAARFDGHDRWLQCAYVRRAGQAVPKGVRWKDRVVSIESPAP